MRVCGLTCRERQHSVGLGAISKPQRDTLVGRLVVRRVVVAGPNATKAMESKKWMEASDVLPMFPTLVWKLQVEADLRDALAARILAALAGMRRDLHYPPVVLPTHWDNFLLPYGTSQKPALEALQSFLQEVAVASPKTKVIVPKYFQPIPLAK